MAPDAWAVAAKEWRHVLARGGRRRRIGPVAPWVVPLALGALIGVAGAGANLALPLFFGAVQCGGFMADAIAGERERHTLETLLASPVADRAVLLGKVLGVTAYGAAVGGCYLLGLVGAAASRGHPVDVPAVAAVVLLLVLGSTLVSAIGALLAMDVETLRQAARRNGVALLPVGAVLAGSVFAVRAGSVLLAAGVLVAFVGVDALLLGWACSRFRRGRLPL